MADLDDIEDVFEDIEDIFEEMLDPEELIEDFSFDPLAVVVGLVAGLAGLFTLVMLLFLAVVVALQFGILPVVVALTVLGFLVTVGAIWAFVHVRSGIPSRLRRKLGRAKRHADETGSNDGPMTEEDAIETLKDQYAAGEITDYEFEQTLDEILTSDRPGEALSGDRSEEPDLEYERR